LFEEDNGDSPSSDFFRFTLFCRMETTDSVLVGSSTLSAFLWGVMISLNSARENFFPKPGEAILTVVGEGVEKSRPLGVLDIPEAADRRRKGGWLENAGEDSCLRFFSNEKLRALLLGTTGCRGSRPIVL